MLPLLPAAAPQAVAWLLSVPGASRTVLDMRIPYSRASLKDVLGKSPDVYACPGGCSRGAAAAVAAAAAASGLELPCMCDGTPHVAVEPLPGHPQLGPCPAAAPCAWLWHAGTQCALDTPCPAAETARDMAQAAYKHAVKLSAFGTDVLGIGCTCEPAGPPKRQRRSRTGAV